jgi:hypothetical protein
MQNIPLQAKRFRAKAQRRKDLKAQGLVTFKRPVNLQSSLRLCAFAGNFMF